MTREEIFIKLTSYLEEAFEIPPDKITADARLFEDLELDSIDAVELVVQLQGLTGKKMKPEQFKTVRTVGDVVECAHVLLSQ